MAKKIKPKISETSPEILMLGYLCIKGADNLTEKVNILDRFGLVDEDIATICGCAVQSVRNARQKRSKPSEVGG
ncbi:MAG: hypothetical protein QY328_04320 [Anaerolineales bacterium]|nr:MAG: hypothetical protein QY328_04320 [Anaerolineales bacterium]